MFVHTLHADSVYQVAVPEHTIISGELHVQYVVVAVSISHVDVQFVYGFGIVCCCVISIGTIHLPI